MDYTITDDEYNALCDVRGQLNFVSDLLCASNRRVSEFDAENMNCFVSAQANSLTRLIASIDARSKAAYEEEKTQPAAQATPTFVLDIDVLTDMFQVVAGIATTKEKLHAIGEKLLDAAIESKGYGRLLRAYYTALKATGWEIVTTNRNGVVTTKFKAPHASDAVATRRVMKLNVRLQSRLESCKVSDSLTVFFNGHEYDVSTIPNVVVGEFQKITRHPKSTDLDTAFAAVTNAANGEYELYSITKVQGNHAGTQVKSSTIVSASPPQSAPKGRKRDKLAGMQRGTVHTEAV